MLLEGTKAPDFKLDDQDGNPTSLADFKGKKVLLWFYPKASTPGCTIEGQELSDEFHKFEKKNKTENITTIGNEKCFIKL